MLFKSFLSLVLSLVPSAWANKPIYNGLKIDLSDYQPSLHIGVLKGREQCACALPYYKQAFQVPVSIKTYMSYKEKNQAMLRGEVDVIKNDLVLYAKAYRDNPDSMIPIYESASNQTRQAVILVRQSSPINQPHDLTRKQIAFVDPHLLLGGLLPKQALDQALPQGGYMIEGYYGSHMNSIQQLLDGTVDASVGYVQSKNGIKASDALDEKMLTHVGGVLHDMYRQGKLKPNELKTIWVSAPHKKLSLVTMSSRLPKQAGDVIFALRRWIQQNDPECDRILSQNASAQITRTSHESYANKVNALNHYYEHTGL